MSATNSTLLANNPLALSSLIFSLIYFVCVSFSFGVVMYTCISDWRRIRCLRMCSFTRDEMEPLHSQEAGESGEDRGGAYVLGRKYRTSSMGSSIPYAYEDPVREGTDMTGTAMIIMLFFLVWALFISSMELEFPAPPVGDNTLFNGQQRNNALGSVAVLTAFGGLLHFIVILCSDWLWKCCGRRG